MIDKIDKHKHLVKMLAKMSDDLVKSALDNLIDKQMIGIREYKQILKKIQKYREDEQK